MPVLSSVTAFYSVLSILSYQLLFLSQRPVNFSVIICVILCAYAVTRLVSSTEDSAMFTENFMNTTKIVSNNVAHKIHELGSYMYQFYFQNT